MVIGADLPSVDNSQTIYIVLSGDTLFSIAKSQGVSVSDLKKWNDLHTNKIFEGQRLWLKASSNKSDEFKELSAPQKNDNISSPLSMLNQNFYKVKKGDTLSSIAEKHSLSTNQLIAWNNLVSTSLNIGQELLLREPDYLKLYNVKPNDTLYAIAKANKLPLELLLSTNGLKEDSLVQVGNKLIISFPSKIQRWHYVKEGDSFESIAHLYATTSQKIKDLNNIRVLSLGSLLRVRSEEEISSLKLDKKNSNELKEEISPKKDENDSKGSQKILTHEVQAGDTLYNISLRYKVLIEDIKKANNLLSDTLYKGIKLIIPLQSNKESSLSDVKGSQEVNDSQKVLKISDSKFSKQLPETVDLKSSKSTKVNLPSLNSSISHSYSWKSLVVLDPKIPLFEWNGDYYYWEHPKKTYQPSHTYFEYWNSPLDAYYKATTLFKAFEKLVKDRPKKSEFLAGKTIILDPGHGGLDPGAIVKSKDGMNRDIYITEDEYVYDVALRMYILLKEHGAEVKMTILAPDHLIRDTSPAANTLINMKNEVYNKESLNLDDTKDCWPNGSQEGLSRRVEVINSLLGHLDKEKIIFISLHADNQPAMPAHTGIYYQQNPEFNDGYSQAAAEILQESMGKDHAYIKGKDLFVLRNNLMKYKLLIELRNVSSVKEAWALRFADMRQKDAEKVVKGILSFFKSSDT